MDAVADRGVVGADVAALVLDGPGDTGRTPGGVEPLAVPGLDLAPLVEHGEAQDVEADVDVPHPLHFEQPPRRDPGPRALRVEPNVDVRHAAHIRNEIG